MLQGNIEGDFEHMHALGRYFVAGMHSAGFPSCFLKVVGGSADGSAAVF